MQPKFPSSPRALAAAMIANADFGDAFIFLFFVIFVRQYLLLATGSGVAWTLALALSVFGLCLYIVTKPFPPQPSGRAFWFTVVPALIIIYLLRATLPDVSFDVLNYRLLHSERSLHGLFYQATDFFPTAAPYNPAPDTLTGLFRHVLGYRLGTIINLLILIWSARIIEKILRPFIQREWPRAVCVLIIMLAEHLLFEISTYMVDLIAVPLLLEATDLALRFDEAENKRRVYAHAALLIGMSIALKLTNAVAGAPLLIFFAFKAVTGKPRLTPREFVSTFTFACIALVAPIVPFSFYLWRLTGNPVFPLANKIFKSQYWPAVGGWDARWGPLGIWETLIWPIVIWFKPARHSELAVYSGRISIGWLVALIALPFVWRRARVRLLCLIFLAGCLVWSAGGMGYSRYGLYLELLAGLTVIVIAASVAGNASSVLKRGGKVFAACVLLALSVQVAIACSLALNYEWSMRPTFLHSRFGSNARYFLRDRSLSTFVTPEDRSRFDNVEVWIESSVKTTALEALLQPDAPIIGIRNPEFLSTKEARRKFMQLLTAVERKRIFTLTDPVNLESARQVLAGAGLVAGEPQPISLRYFSRDPTFDLLLIEVKPIWQTASKGPAPRRQPLPFNAFDAGISVAQPPVTLRRGETFVLKVALKNLSPITWPGQQPEWKHQVTVANIWLDEKGVRLSELERRAVLTRDLAPGESAELPLTLIAPEAPGNYTLKIDAVQESVAWFGDLGSEVLELKIKVE